MAEPPRDTQADKDAKNPPQYIINREVLKQEKVTIQSGYEPRDKSLKFAIRQCWLTFSWLAYFSDLFPVIKWLPKYKPRDLVGDLLAGTTVAIMQVPQGLAYAMLADVPAEVGLYMAFFTVLVYAFFGTSRHASVGTFAVASMMTLKVVRTHSSSNTAENGTLPEDQSEVYTHTQIASAAAFVTGLIHIAMHVLHLGLITNLMSESLVQGFTTAVAVHVIVSQMKEAFGVYVQRYKGVFKLIYTLRDLCLALPDTNLVALAVFALVFIFLMISNEVIKPRWKKKIIVPFPSELLTVVGGALVSRYTNIGELYNVRIVGDIPTGLPFPEFPPYLLFPKIVIDCFAIALVTYSVSMSMAFIFAKKHFYQIAPNQELFAIGLANVIGSMFSCMPISCSISRSIIQEQAGGKTQIASLITAFFVLLVLLWIGPFFEPLPRCVLAALIVVALQGLLLQFGRLKQVYKEGKLELLTWLGTFFGVLLIDIDYGLLIGFAISLLALYIKGWRATSSTLGTLPGTAIYVDLQNHKDALEIPNIKIFRYSGYINFASESSFKQKLYTAIKMTPRLISVSLMKVKDSRNQIGPFKVLIIDLSTVSHVDVAASKEFTEIIHEMSRNGIKVYFASPQDRVYDKMIHSMNLGEGPFEIFPTIHDAVLYAQANIN